MGTKLDIEQFIQPLNFDIEKAYLGKKQWWYVKNLVDIPAIEIDIDLMSLDLCVRPWNLDTIGDFIEHTVDINNCSAHNKYPIIMTPQGWIMNGWHRVVRAILNGEKTIKARRLIKIPPEDGVDEERSE